MVRLWESPTQVVMPYKTRKGARDVSLSFSDLFRVEFSPLFDVLCGHCERAGRNQCAAPMRTIFTEELPWLSEQDKRLIMREALCAW
jgi:hypothetical protein